jgi:hypothetical protein
VGQFVRAGEVYRGKTEAGKKQKQVVGNTPTTRFCVPSVPRIKTLETASNQVTRRQHGPRLNRRAVRFGYGPGQILVRLPLLQLPTAPVVPDDKNTRYGGKPD